MNLLSYDEIIRALLIGMTFSIPILAAYYLVDRICSKHVEQLEEALRGMRSDRSD